MKEDTLDSNTESITLYKGDFCGLQRTSNSSFKIKRHFESSEISLPVTFVNFHKHLLGVGDLFVIDDQFFVSGICSKGQHYILKVLSWKLVQIYHHPQLNEKCMLGMSKSICGNILVNFFNKILHLSTKGVVMKRIILPFIIRDVLQLSRKRYAVCCDGGARIIDVKGNF